MEYPCGWPDVDTSATTLAATNATANPEDFMVASGAKERVMKREKAGRAPEISESG